MILQAFPANVIMVLTLCTGFIVLKTDLIYVSVQKIYPNRSLTFDLILLIPRYIHVASVSYLMFVFVIGTLEFVIFELYVASHDFYHFNAYFDRCAIQSSRIRADLPLLIKLFNQIKLLEHVCDEAYFYFLPFLLLFGGSILVTCSFGTIRLHDVIPMPFYLGLPCLSVTVLVVVMALFPAASAVHGDSCRVLRNMTAVVPRKTYISKQLRAQRPFRFSFGSLFIAKNSTKTTFIRCVFDNIVDCLLLYK